MTTDPRVAHVTGIVTRCLIKAYHLSLVRLMNVIGVAQTVAMMRHDADALEDAEEALEGKRQGRKTGAQA